MVVTLEGRRAIRLQGNKAHPLTRGSLCARTVRYLERVYSPDRILRPLLRQGGVPREIGWEEALNIAADVLRRARDRHGPHAVMHYRSAGSMGLSKRLADRFWNLFGGVTELTGDFCLGAGKTALERCFGDYRAHEWADLRHSRTIILWGRDPFTSGPHLLPFLRSAAAAGARVLSVNPTDLGHARIVPDRVKVRPGGDLALALGVARRLVADGGEDRGWLERHAHGHREYRDSLLASDPARLAAAAGVTEGELALLAQRLRVDAPVAILLGTGVIRHRLGLEAACAIASLAALLGSVGRPGGGISFAVRHARGMDLSCLRPRRDVRNREMACAAMPGALPSLDPPVEVAWIEAANPANSFGDSAAAAAALRSIPFRVVADFHRTATTELADLVLPVPSFLEDDDLVPSWGHFHLARQRAVIAPLGQARPDLRIYQDLALRLGFGGAMEGGPHDWTRRMLGPLEQGCGVGAALEARGFARNPAHEEVPWADGRFATPTGRFEFPLEVATADPAPPADRRYPLTLLSPKSPEHHLSQVLPRRRRPHYDVRMAPTAMAARGIRDGDRVRLRSSRGAIQALARGDASLHPGVAVLPQSGWGPDGNDVNHLTPPTTAADGVTFAYYDCLVEVEPIS